MIDTNNPLDEVARSVAGMSIEKNKLLVGAWLNAWNANDLDAAEMLLDERFIRHDANIPDVVGPHAQRQFIAAVITAFPELRIDAQLLISEGDIVISRLRAQGTQRGEFMGVPRLAAPSTSRL